MKRANQLRYLLAISLALVGLISAAHVSIEAQSEVTA